MTEQEVLGYFATCRDFSKHRETLSLDENLLESHSFVSRPARPRTQHGCHHNKKVKPEAATAVIELLMMGGKTPETC
jgi:hypothetical protein